MAGQVLKQACFLLCFGPRGSLPHAKGYKLDLSRNTGITDFGISNHLAPFLRQDSQGRRSCQCRSVCQVVPSLQGLEAGADFCWRHFLEGLSTCPLPFKFLSVPDKALLSWMYEGQVVELNLPLPQPRPRARSTSRTAKVRSGWDLLWGSCRGPGLRTEQKVSDLTLIQGVDLPGEAQSQAQAPACLHVGNTFMASTSATGNAALFRDVLEVLKTGWL